MTNTKNYVHSINNKFKVGNPLNISATQTMADFNTIYNNSKIKNYNTHKNNKINLKLNFQNINIKSQNQLIVDSDKKDNSRNFKKFNFYESSHNHSLNNKNDNFFFESTDKFINIYSPKKIMKKEFKNQKNAEDEKENDGNVKQRTIEINKFISMNLSRKQLQEMLHEKLKISIDTTEPLIDQKELFANISSKNIKKINENKKNSNSLNSKIKMPKIVSFYNPNINYPISPTKSIYSTNINDKSEFKESKKNFKENKEKDKEKKSKKEKKKEKKEKKIKNEED
jgi:hypothetical protein